MKKAVDHRMLKELFAAPFIDILQMTKFIVSKACAGKLNPGITGAAQIFVWTLTFQSKLAEFKQKRRDINE